MNRLCAGHASQTRASLFVSWFCDTRSNNVGTFAFRVGHAQLSHDFVGVVLVARPLFFRVVQVGRRAAVGIGPQQLHLVHPQLAGLHIGMCPSYALRAKHCCHALGTSAVQNRLRVPT